MEAFAAVLPEDFVAGFFAAGFLAAGFFSAVSVVSTFSSAADAALALLRLAAGFLAAVVVALLLQHHGDRRDAGL